jgi:hypothetical protein
MVLMSYRTILHRALQIRILIWDPGIGVLGSPEFEGVDIRVERLLEELTEDLLHMIILLIKSIGVSCVMSTWSFHDLSGAYYMSHRWIWDPGIILIQLLLENKHYFSREDYNVPIFCCCYVIEWDACQSSRWDCQRVQEILRGFIGPDLHHSSYFIIRIHSTQLGFGSVAFRQFP